jgi:hypothetical protein
LHERDIAIKKSLDTHRAQLLVDLDDAVEDVARTVPEFTADDVREHLGALADSVDLRVLGGVLKRVANRGLIRADGYRPSRYRRGSPVALWRSRAFDAA